MTGIEKLVKEYLEYLEIQRQRSEKTIENYSRYLARFLSWAKIKSPADIDADLVTRFQDYLAGVKGGTGHRLVPTGRSDQPPALKQATKYYHLIALRGFLNYLARQNITSLKAKKVKLGQTPSRQLDILADEEIEKLLGISSGKGLAGLRDRAILEILFSTGLQVSQLCSLTRLDFNQKQAQLSLSQASGQIRLVYLSDPAKKALTVYLNKRQDGNPALLVSLGRGKKQTNVSRLTPRSIQRIVKKYAILTGIDPAKVTPSALRHAFACGLLRAGAETKTLQKLLGHAHLSTTQIYTKLAKH